MSTLPNGTEISKQFGPESYYGGTLLEGSVSLSVSKTTVSVGESITVSGSYVDPQDVPNTGANITAEIRDSGDVLVSKSEDTDDSGEYVITITPEETGTMIVQTIAEGIDPQFGPEGYEYNEPAFNSQFGPEGYES